VAALIIYNVAGDDVRAPQVILEAATVRVCGPPAVAPDVAIVTYEYTVPPLGTVTEGELKVGVAPDGRPVTPVKYT